MLGGTCLNVGCIPSKALLDSSHHFEFIQQHARDHGIDVEASLDVARIQARKDTIVQGLTQGIAGLLKKNKVTTLHGHARLQSAWTGITEQAAQAAGRTLRTGTFPFMASGRARAMGDAEGFVKIVADADNDRVLGVHIIGPNASELIAEAVTVMEFGGRAEDIARTVRGHPTLAEAMHEAALAVDKRTIHF